MPKKHSQEQILETFRKIHGDRYDYSLVEYVNTYAKVKIICPEHGVFEQTPKSHLRGHGCVICGHIKDSITRSSNTEEFIKKAIKIHGNRYDYSAVRYELSRKKIFIICPIHGVFKQTPNDHLSGYGCAGCFGKIKLTTEQFIKRARDVHGDKYDYSLLVYKNQKTKIKVICPTHGIFEQYPINHMRHECQSCATNKKKTTEDFIREAKSVHGNKYDYTATKYKNIESGVTIKCKKHGPFKQKARYHLRGSGCSKCAKNFSVMENKWLDSLNISELKRQYKIGRYRVDGYDPSTNTVYEFLGDYWHGNPKVYDPKEINTAVNKTFGYLFEKTTKRTKHLQKLGYNVIEMWESDYIN